MMRLIASIGALALLAGVAASQDARDDASPQPGESGPRELFPHVFVDPEARVVELAGKVPIVTNDPEAPVVYLELIACIPDTKEHEVIVVTPARPRDVHAALLLIGLEPGSPGRFEWEGEALIGVPPEGDEVTIELIFENEQGERVSAPAWSFVKNLETGETLPERNWVFAGSRLVDRAAVGGRREFYDADGTGVLIGLTTFGSEVLAWPDVISPDTAIEEPVWIADPERTPPFDTPVTIRIKPADQ